MHEYEWLASFWSALSHVFFSLLSGNISMPIQQQQQQQRIPQYPQHQPQRLAPQAQMEDSQHQCARRCASFGGTSGGQCNPMPCPSQRIPQQQSIGQQFALQRPPLPSYNQVRWGQFLSWAFLMEDFRSYFCLCSFWNYSLEGMFTATIDDSTVSGSSMKCIVPVSILVSRSLGVEPPKTVTLVILEPWLSIIWPNRWELNYFMLPF